VLDKTLLAREIQFYASEADRAAAAGMPKSSGFIKIWSHPSSNNCRKSNDQRIGTMDDSRKDNAVATRLLHQAEYHLRRSTYFDDIADYEQARHHRTLADNLVKQILAVDRNARAR
jgi:hypothetical protein